MKSWVCKCNDCADGNPHPARRDHTYDSVVLVPYLRDALGPLPVTYNGNEYASSSYFRKWIEAYAIPNQEAETVADRFADFVCHFGIPKEVHSDQGRNFQSRVFQESLKLFGSDHIGVYCIGYSLYAIRFCSPPQMRFGPLLPCCIT